MWTATRLIGLLFAVVDLVLVARFALKLLGADSGQSLVSAIYRNTEPLVAPFRGMLVQPVGSPPLEIDTLLAIVVYGLVGALVAGVIHAFTGRRGEATI